jgi:integrase
MSILAECPMCHTKQSAKNKKCRCGENLDKQKRSKKVRYWISFRMPDGKQKRKPIGYSVQEARDADGKKRSQKRENRIFDMLPESKITFQELTGWYIELRKVKNLKSYKRIKGALGQFNVIFGRQIVNSILPAQLEEYQERRIDEGKSPATVDMELSLAKTMVTKGFDNGKVGVQALKAFRRIKRKLKRGNNSRDRILSFEEYKRLLEHASVHLRSILIVAFNTGMRKGEILNLKWSNIDRKKGFIRLKPEATKETKSKNIPINHHVLEVLNEISRAIHHDNVFTYRSRPIKDDFRTALHGACKAAGIIYGQEEVGGFRFHDIRTTVKTNMMRAGIDKALRDTILGHSLEGMDTFYIKPMEDDLKDAMDKYTQWLDEQMDCLNCKSQKSI